MSPEHESPALAEMKKEFLRLYTEALIKYLNKFTKGKTAEQKNDFFTIEPQTADLLAKYPKLLGPLIDQLITSLEAQADDLCEEEELKPQPNFFRDTIRKGTQLGKKQEDLTQIDAEPSLAVELLTLRERVLIFVSRFKTDPTVMLIQSAKLYLGEKYKRYDATSPRQQLEETLDIVRGQREAELEDMGTDGRFTKRILDIEQRKNAAKLSADQDEEIKELLELASNIEQIEQMITALIGNPKAFLPSKKQ